MKNLICLLLLSALAGCASSRQAARPPAASFEGTLSQHVIPADILGENWRMEQGLMVDDIDHPPAVPALRKKWADAFLRQRRAAGARSYGEVFYYSPEHLPVKVSTMILVYHDADGARRHWNEKFGAGLMTGGYRRTNQYGDKSVEHKEYDDLVVWAGNVIIQVSQPVRGESNDVILAQYMRELGIDQPAQASQ